MLLAKLLVVIVLIFIVVSLFTALYYLIKSPDNSASVVKSLSVRIGLSLFLIAMIFVGSQLGIIQPHGFGQ